MSNQTLNQELVERIQGLSWSKSREDKSKSHQQWLNHFSSRYGHSWESLIHQVAALKKAAHVERLAAAEVHWITRFSEKVWGEIPHPDEQTRPLPIGEGVHMVPWPHCLNGNHIFHPGTEEPHELVSGPVWSFDEDAIEFYGEQLWTAPDKFVFETLIMMSRELPTGATVDFTWKDLERVTGQLLRAIEPPTEQDTFQKALWRLTHGILVFERFGFKGPLLKFADVSNSPERFRVAFNPDFAKFYYFPSQKIKRVEITTQDKQRLLWSEKLTTYLACRAKPWTFFRLGEWLETLVTNELNALLKCLDDYHEGKSPHAETADIMNVVLLTTSIETCQHKVNFTVDRLGELLDAFCQVATFEQFKRLGLIELPRTIGISSNQDMSFRLTEAGMAVGLQVHESLL